MTIYKALADIESKGGNGVLCTVVSTKGSTPRHEGSKMLVYPDGSFTGTVGGGEMENRVISEALAALREGKTHLVTYSMVNPKEGDPGVCGGTVEIFIEPIRGKPKMIIVGGGHVGRALTHLAKWLGFVVGVSDDRPEFCSPEMHPDADVFYPVHLKELPTVAHIDNQTYVVLVTRGVAIDIPGVPALLETDAAYIGIIGSKRRWLTTKKALEEAGLPQERIQKIRSPIGLELNAETPEEIAVSIMAEILLIRNGGTGSVMAI